MLYFVSIMIGLLILSIAFLYPFNRLMIEYLWQEDMKEAVADLDYDSEVWDIQQKTFSKNKLFSWETTREIPVSHYFIIKFIDGEEREVFVPKRKKWYRTILVDRGAKELRELRKKNAELEEVLLDLDNSKDHLEERIHEAAMSEKS